MGEHLTSFRCALCGHSAFRYDTAYDSMVDRYERAWCILCAPPRTTDAARRRELMDIAQALIAQSHGRIADYRAAQRRSHL
jgi:hypothetical protein